MDPEKSNGTHGGALAAQRKLASPLAGLSASDLAGLGDVFCREHGITGAEDRRVFRLGAQVAGSEGKWEGVEGLSEGERAALRKEEQNKWANPKMLYLVVVSKFIALDFLGVGCMGLTRCSLFAVCHGPGDGQVFSQMALPCRRARYFLARLPL